MAFKLNGDPHLPAGVPAADVAVASAHAASGRARSYLSDNLAGLRGQGEPFAPSTKLCLAQQPATSLRAAPGVYVWFRERRSSFNAEAYLRPASVISF